MSSIHPVQETAILATCLLLWTCSPVENETHSGNLSERCDLAFTQLEQCFDSVPPEFLQACRQQYRADEFEMIDSLVAAQCGDAQFFAKADLIEEAFAIVCTPAIIAAAIISKIRNPEHQALPEPVLGLLRDQFGQCVDDVKVHFSATLIDSWSVGGREIIHGGAEGLTLWPDVYLTDAYPAGEFSMRLLKHEYAHAEQAYRVGGLTEFAEAYCREYRKAGFSYEDNAFEVEARSASLSPATR